MKVGDFVLCIETRPGAVSNYEMREKIINGQTYEVTGSGHYSGLGISYDWIEVDNMSTWWEAISFRKVEFPPSLQEEIQDCLTRELIPTN